MATFVLIHGAGDVGWYLHLVVRLAAVLHDLVPDAPRSKRCSRSWCCNTRAVTPPTSRPPGDSRRPGPLDVAPRRDSGRARARRRTPARRGIRRRAPTPSPDRCRARAGAHRRGNGLDGDRRTPRRPRSTNRFRDRPAQPCGRGRRGPWSPRPGSASSLDSTNSCGTTTESLPSAPNSHNEPVTLDARPDLLPHSDRPVLQRRRTDSPERPARSDQRPRSISQVRPTDLPESPSGAPASPGTCQQPCWPASDTNIPRDVSFPRLRSSYL